MADARFFNYSGNKSLAEIMEITGTTVYGELPQGVTESSTFSDVSTLGSAQGHDVAVLHNKKYIAALASTQAGVILIESAYADRCPKGAVALTSPTPYKAYAQLATSFYPESESFRTKTNSISPIHPTATFGENCEIESGVVIGENAEVGKNCFIGANTVIGRGVKIGDNCKIAANVTITHAVIGNNVILHTGIRIGQAGFGFHMDHNGHFPMPQLGRVIIQDHVDIGANTTIDRGSAEDTFIGASTRIDNLVMIAHNVHIGRGCIIVAMVGISGSTKIGDYTSIGGQAGLIGHLNIGKGVQISVQSLIVKDIPDGMKVGGSPAVPSVQWHRQTIALKKLALNKRTD